MFLREMSGTEDTCSPYKSRRYPRLAATGHQISVTIGPVEGCTHPSIHHDPELPAGKEGMHG